MVSYTNKLEDTVWCNDKSISNYGNYNPTSSLWNNDLSFDASGREYNNLVCPNKGDAYTVNDTTNGNGALTYPIGLITTDELMLAGYHYYYNHYDGKVYVNAGINYFTMTPATSYGFANVSMYGASTRRYDSGTYGNEGTGIRPMISLKHGILVIGSGEGTAANPYVVK
jgi:hypothetical protein